MKANTCKGCGALFVPRPKTYYGSVCCSRPCADIVHGQRVSKMMHRRKRTKPEKALMRLVGGAYPDAEFERRFGAYSVDVYVPSLHIAFEADGAYWHKGREKHDAERDLILMTRFSLPVVRFGENELMRMKWPRGSSCPDSNRSRYVARSVTIERDH